MTTKATTNWANRTKQDAAAIKTPTIPQGMVVQGRGGELEPIVAYYRFTQPRTPNPLSRVLSKGDTIEGTYEGSFESKAYPGNYTYKVRTAEGLVGLPHCQQLGQDLSNVAKGSSVYILYKGQETVKTGKFAGKGRHAFLVASEPTGGQAA